MLSSTAPLTGAVILVMMSHHRPPPPRPQRTAVDITITIQQDSENAAGYHPPWSDPAPPLPASHTLHDIFTTISAGLQEARAPQIEMKR